MSEIACFVGYACTGGYSAGTSTYRPRTQSDQQCRYDPTGTGNAPYESDCKVSEPSSRRFCYCVSEGPTLQPVSAVSRSPSYLRSPQPSTIAPMFALSNRPSAGPVTMRPTVSARQTQVTITIVQNFNGVFTAALNKVETVNLMIDSTSIATNPTQVLTDTIVNILESVKPAGVQLLSITNNAEGTGVSVLYSVSVILERSQYVDVASLQSGMTRTIVTGVTSGLYRREIEASNCSALLSLVPTANVTVSSLAVTYLVTDSPSKYPLSPPSTITNAPIPSSINSPPSATGGDSGSISTLIIAVAASVGVLVLLVLFGCLYYRIFRKKPETPAELDADDAPTRMVTPGAPHPLPSRGPSGILLFSAADMASLTNDFDVTSIIGRGSLATVFQGSYALAAVAVKKFDLSAIATNEQHQHFAVEVSQLAACAHPNVLRLLGACVDSGCLCLVSPMLSLGNLSDAMANGPHRKEVLSNWRVRMQLAIDITNALDYLHTATNAKLVMLHRDLKLSNILLESRDGRYHAVLCDMGVSHALQRPATAVIGTLGYIDPLYAMGNAYNVRSDIFSLGVVLLQLLTGMTSAYDSSQLPPALYARLKGFLHGQGFLVAQTNKWPEVPADALGELISFCIADASEDRPESCRAVAAGLMQILDDYDNRPAAMIGAFSTAPSAPPLPEPEDCLVCNGDRGVIDCRLLPCMHSCCCYADAQDLIREGRSCPLCQSAVDQVQREFQGSAFAQTSGSVDFLNNFTLASGSMEFMYFNHPSAGEEGEDGAVPMSAVRATERATNSQKSL